MNSVVHINHTKLHIIEYLGQRVATLSQIDAVHARPEGTARRNFNTNKRHLIEGEDFCKMSANEFRMRFPNILAERATEDITLMYEAGYLMLVKSFTDDLAWKVQRQLVKNYFRNTQIRSTPQIPDFNNPAVAARAWAEQYELRQQLEVTTVAQAEALALAKPKVEYVDRYMAANGAATFRQVAKLLDAKEVEFRAFLEDKKILYRLNGVLSAYQSHLDAGRFVVKNGVSTRNGHAFTLTMFTPAGVKWITDKWNQRDTALA